MCRDRRDCDEPGCAPAEAIPLPTEVESIPPFWEFNSAVGWRLVRLALWAGSGLYWWVGHPSR